MFKRKKAIEAEQLRVMGEAELQRLRQELQILIRCRLLFNPMQLTLLDGAGWDVHWLKDWQVDLLPLSPDRLDANPVFTQVRERAGTIGPEVRDLLIDWYAQFRANPRGAVEQTHLVVNMFDGAGAHLGKAASNILDGLPGLLAHMRTAFPSSPQTLNLIRQFELDKMLR